jgi:NAD(P)-dependent dehydrogenase (short-subunit alcohol dehydrogenase family)
MGEGTPIEGRVVLVTGASGGIGCEIVRAFLAAGAAEVIAAGRTPPAEMQERVSFLELDVTEPRSASAAAGRVGARVDILVNNSGVNANQRLAGADLAAARREIEVNYFGLLHMYAAFAPHLQRRGGAIVNVLSMLAHANLPLTATYCASKAAALSLTQAMRAELAPRVRVHSIFPPAVDTAMTANSKVPKMAPAQVAADIVAAVRDGIEDSYPGVAANVRAALQQDWKAVERTHAARLHGAGQHS